MFLKKEKIQQINLLDKSINKLNKMLQEGNFVGFNL